MCRGAITPNTGRASTKSYRRSLYRGDGLAFEPPGEPSGLRSTACPVPLACSSMLLVLPGFAAPLVAGGCGLGLLMELAGVPAPPVDILGLLAGPLVSLEF